MLNLAVSSALCAPGRKSEADSARPSTCRTCGAPGGRNGELLEKHQAGKQPLYLCPLCHMVLHLDMAGRRNAGRVVWLPELGQEQLNLLCLATFVAMHKAGVYRKEADFQPMLTHALRLYGAFERRAEAVELFLAGKATQSPIPQHTMSSPAFVASLIVNAQRSAKLNPATMAQRLDGLRLLPYPKAFDGYIGQVSRLVLADFPANTWMPLVAQFEREQREAREAQQRQAAESAEHFDAGDEAAPEALGEPPAELDGAAAPTTLQLLGV